MLAIVTGGTSGIGFEISKQFVNRGDDVIALYKSDDEKANNATKLLNCGVGTFTAVKLDITNVEAVKEYFSNLSELDYLINCAGITIEDDFERQPVDDIRKVIDVNLFGRIICAKYAIPLLKKSQQPRIVNIASRFAEKPFPGAMGYCCSEAATVMLTKVLALEFAGTGIKCNTISPSLTITPLTDDLYTQEEKEELSKKNPTRRLGKPEDVANLIMFLCSEKSDYINGENINVNGGLLLI